MNTLCAFFLALALTPGYMLLPADTVLYQATVDGYTPLCTLPASYYVSIIGEDRDGYTPVGWLDINGFIRTADVETVDYTPVDPHCVRSVTTNNDLNPVNIRSTPDHTVNNVVGSLPHGKTATVYGEATGSALIPQVGDRWYYIRYSDGTTAYTGYVYSAQVVADPVTPHTGERVTPPAPEPIETDGSIPTVARILLIVALCIPAVAVVLLIFKPVSPKKTPRGL